MRVLMVAPEPFREPRGTPISIYQRLCGLAALGHTVDLITYPFGEDVAIPAVRIHRTVRIPFLRQVRIGPSWGKLLLDLLLFLKAAAMLIRNRYQVIHSHEEAAFFCVILSALSRTPHLYDMHSSLPLQMVNFGYGRSGLAVKLFSALESWAVNSCDALITIGSDLEEQVAKIRPSARQIRIDNLPVQAMGTVPDSSAAESLRCRLGLKGKTSVLYTGTFERYQGLDLLMGSAEIVSKHQPEVVFVLVGGRPQQVEYWKDQAERRGLGCCTRFVGSVPLEETATYMLAADILVSPRTGGISVPLKIYSYLLSGKPIVATKLPTHTHLLDDTIALLTEPTEQAFADGIMRLALQSALRERLGTQARSFAEEKYSWAEYLHRLSGIYSVLQSPGPPSRHRPQRSDGAPDRQSQAPAPGPSGTDEDRTQVA